MKRDSLQYLKDWINEKDLKPLIIRGARQVGKTWVVRALAEQTGRQLIEFNFEARPQDKELFSSNDPVETMQKISSFLGHDVSIGKSILFLDEIQAVPELLAKLRWFAEGLPELAVIAAGSLLEFVLDKHQFSMPVGRITYMHMEPLSFEEFLLAKNQVKLVELIQNYSVEKTLPLVTHDKLMTLFKEYLFVGGMPAAVYTWVNDHSLDKVGRIHSDLLATYRDDFSKYAGRIAIENLNDVLNAVPRLLGRKFVYSQINRDVQAASLKSAIKLLCQARVCHKVQATAANGVPLASEINSKYYKALFLDCGLVSSSLGLQLAKIQSMQDINLINQGAISEQVVGQLLRCIEPAYVEPMLFYWLREQKTSSAEIDYVIQDAGKVIPVEVKSGKSGSLKSLHLFMKLKKLKQAIRINSDLPSICDVKVILHDQTEVNYELLSVPFYLVGQLHRLLA